MGHAIFIATWVWICAAIFDPSFHPPQSITCSQKITCSYGCESCILPIPLSPPSGPSLHVEDQEEDQEEVQEEEKEGCVLRGTQGDGERNGTASNPSRRVGSRALLGHHQPRSLWPHRSHTTFPLRTFPLRHGSEEQQQHDRRSQRNVENLQVHRRRRRRRRQQQQPIPFKRCSRAQNCPSRGWKWSSGSGRCWRASRAPSRSPPMLFCEDGDGSADDGEGARRGRRARR